MIGVISRNPKLSIDDWTRAIARGPELFAVNPFRSMSPRLITPATRQIENPFRGGTVTVTPRVGEVSLVIGGEAVARLQPSDEFDRDGEVLVHSRLPVREEVKAAVGLLAKEMGAMVEWFDVK